MKIKAISIWQPWASLIAVGAKKYETRPWATSYRGPLLICTGKKQLSNQELSWLDFETKYSIRNALCGILNCPRDVIDFANKVKIFLPYGKAIAIVDLVDIYRICDRFRSARTEQEKQFGDFSLNRYAWKLENVRAIIPFPVTGRQGLFEVELPEGIEAP